MNAMRPDQIAEEMDRQRLNDLRSYIFLIIMLVVAPIVAIAALLLNVI